MSASIVRKGLGLFSDDIVLPTGNLIIIFWCNTRDVEQAIRRKPKRM